MGIRTRITIGFVAVMAVVIFGVSTLLVTRLRAELWRTVDDALAQRSTELVEDAEDEPAEVGTPGGVVDDIDVVAQVLDRNGAVLETTRRIGPESLLLAAGILDLPRSLDATIPIDGTPTPVRLSAARAAQGVVVVVGTPLTSQRAAVASVVWTLALAGPALLAFTGALVWWLTGRALRPVDRLRAEAEALSFSDDRRRLHVPAADDEIARLADTLNRMLARLEAVLDRERRFVDDAAHELRTPLAVVRTELDLALGRPRSPSELLDALRCASEEVDALTVLAERLLVLARADRGVLDDQHVTMDLTELVQTVCAAYAGRDGVSIDVTADGPVHVGADPLLVRQALGNLLDNALAHGGRGVAVDVSVRTDAHTASLIVHDRGPGFADHILPTAFDPFTRADGARRRGSGTGLGLAIVKAIADTHGGSVSAVNDDGARVTVMSPRRTPSPA